MSVGTERAGTSWRAFGEEFSFAVARGRPDGPLTIDDMDMMIRAAIDGVGLAFSLEQNVAPNLASGRAGPRPRGVVPAIRRLRPLLPEPAAAARGADGLIMTLRFRQEAESVSRTR
jgi:DNA-binding transcriptional LysR family regulator